MLRSSHRRNSRYLADGCGLSHWRNLVRLPNNRESLRCRCRVLFGCDILDLFQQIQWRRKFHGALRFALPVSCAVSISQIDWRERARGPTFPIGALGAGAFLLKGNLIGVWLAIGLYWIIRRDIALRWIAWSVGGIAVLLAVSIVFAIFGAWSALWDAVIVYNFAYIDASLGDRVEVLGEMRRRLVIISLPLAARGLRVSTIGCQAARDHGLLNICCRWP